MIDKPQKKTKTAKKPSKKKAPAPTPGPPAFVRGFPKKRAQEICDKFGWWLGADLGDVWKIGCTTEGMEAFKGE